MKDVIVVMPAYNAKKTLEKTCANLPKIYSEIIVCDDGSVDGTFEQSQKLNVTTLRHDCNRGYGANQKTLYDYALAKSPSIIIMVHPDNQYTTDCLPEMVAKIEGGAGLVIGTRMKTALKNRMPWWKYLSNRFLTFLQNRTFRTNLSEFHSGLRGYDARSLASLPYRGFSDDFVFDSEVIANMRGRGYSIEEVPTECYYNKDVSSINFARSVTYGLQTLKTLLRYKSGYWNK